MTRNKIRCAYIVSIDDEEVFTKDDVEVFTKDDVERVLKRFFDEQAAEFEVEFAPEKRLTAAQLRKALLEHAHSLYSPEARADEEHTSELVLRAFVLSPPISTLISISLSRVSSILM